MTSKELILQEMDEVPEPILAEVLDFLRFLKAKRLQASPMVTVVSPEGEATVALEDLKQAIPEISSQLGSAQYPIEQVRQDLNQALINSGYTSKASIVELVRNIKKEIQVERDSH